MICQTSHQSRHPARAGTGVVGRLTETVLCWARALGRRTAHWPGGSGGCRGWQWRGSADCRHRAGAGGHHGRPSWSSSHASITGADVATTTTALLSRDLTVVRLATKTQIYKLGPSYSCPTPREIALPAVSSLQILLVVVVVVGRLPQHGAAPGHRVGAAGRLTRFHALRLRSSDLRENRGQYFSELFTGGALTSSSIASRPEISS